MPILSQIRTPALRELYQYWAGMQGTHRLPSRSDLDPVEMAPFLPHVVLLDVEDDPRQYRIRVWGTAVTDGYGEDLTGRYHHELTTGKHELDADATLAETMASGRPTCFRLDFETTGAFLQEMERIVLPLSDDGQKIDKLLCGVAYKFVSSPKSATASPA